MSVEQGKKVVKDGQYLKARTKQFALEIIRLYVSLPKKTEALVMGKQLLERHLGRCPLSRSSASTIQCRVYQ